MEGGPAPRFGREASLTPLPRSTESEGSRDAEVRWTAFFIFEEGELVCERVYFDASPMLRQWIGPVSIWRPAGVLRLFRVLRLMRLQSR
jgi:hypothetical protein